MLLITKALPTLLKYNPRNVGRMVQPRAVSRMADTPRAGFLWAADNDCFQGFHEERYLHMLELVAGTPGCLFITCPDVVGDAETTLEWFDHWNRIVRLAGPVALVGQDGLTVDATPWDDFDALFIGGSTEWKLSEDARLLMKEAQSRGKWVHMGRVNSWRRVEYAKACGVDSIDGTQLSWFSDTYIDRFAAMASSPRQGFLHG